MQYRSCSILCIIYAGGMSSVPPVALTIAGSDCCGGAGIQADLKTFQHFGVHGLTAVTCVVSETPKVVEAVHAVPVDVIESQVSLLLRSYPVAAIKTGMLHSREVIEAVARCLVEHPSIPVVVDPVMVASSGSPLIEEGAVEAYREHLFPEATLITPNLHEIEVLLRTSVGDLETLEQTALQLALETDSAVLAKGGHLDEEEDCTDILAMGDELSHFSHPRLPDADTHGTGCTLAAAIAANLALGEELESAVCNASDYLAAALKSRYTFDHPEAIQALNQGTDRKSLDS